ncbi:hypothetical protein B7463_g6372, partial [Scytalidium lignicola]
MSDNVYGNMSDNMHINMSEDMLFNMNNRPRNRFAPAASTEFQNPNSSNENSPRYSQLFLEALYKEQVDPNLVTKSSFPGLTRQEWRQILRERCRILWDEIPPMYLNNHLSAQRDHLILMRAALDWMNDVRRTKYVQIPPPAGVCDLGMLTGKPSTSNDNGTRDERIAFWDLLNTLPQGYGKDLIHDLGGDPQQRILYLAHRYIRDIWWAPPINYE